MNLEPFDLLFDCRGSRQQNGYGYQGPQLRRDALAQCQAGQNRRAEPASDGSD